MEVCQFFIFKVKFLAHPLQIWLLFLHKQFNNIISLLLHPKLYKIFMLLHHIKKYFLGDDLFRKAYFDFLLIITLNFNFYNFKKYIQYINCIIYIKILFYYIYLFIFITHCFINILRNIKSPCIQSFIHVFMNFKMPFI